MVPVADSATPSSRTYDSRMGKPKALAEAAEPGLRRPVRTWAAANTRWLIVGAASVVSLVAVVVLVSRNSDPPTTPIEPTTPTEVSEAWLDAFQAHDLNAARELSCEKLRLELADPEIFKWTRLVDGSWTFQPQRINGDQAEIEAVRFSNGDATLFHLTREGGKWQVCDPFDVQPNW